MTPRVVVSLISEQQEFQRLQAEDAQAAAARPGLEVELVFADNNAVLQIQQLFPFVHLPEGERPAAIVVETVTGEGLERVATWIRSGQVPPRDVLLEPHSHPAESSIRP